MFMMLMNSKCTAVKIEMNLYACLYEAAIFQIFIGWY